MKALWNKFKNMPQSLKATLVFAIASFATSGINYLTTPIFTRLLSGAEYGTVAVYNSWYSIVRVFASMTLIFPGILNVGLYDPSFQKIVFWCFYGLALVFLKGALAPRRTLLDRLAPLGRRIWNTLRTPWKEVTP